MPDRLPRIACSVTFLTPSEGGRTQMPLLSQGYRPHVVIGDPAQRRAIVAEGNCLVEEYIGVSFDDGPADAEAGTELAVLLTLMYFPHPMYDSLRPGVTFTVREGPYVVAFGSVHRRID